MSSSLFGKYAVRLDPWEVELGAELRVDFTREEEEGARADLDLEIPSVEWAPVRPTGSGARPPLAFVDGVRRIEARLLLRKAARDGVRATYGAFGTFAIGAARAVDGKATWGSSEIHRLLVTGGGASLEGSIEVGKGLAYQPIVTLDPDPDGPLRALQAAMRLAEGRLALTESTADAWVIVDGPLTFDAPPPRASAPASGKVIGFVKSLHQLYIGERVSMLPELAVGERTPLFGLYESTRFPRYSWFLRLARPLPGESELAGLARLEVSERVGLDAAVDIANRVGAFLPRFVPTRSRDPRSPQNLVPIGALEAHLRRSLGDRKLIGRRLRALIAREDFASRS